MISVFYSVMRITNSNSLIVDVAAMRDRRAMDAASQNATGLPYNAVGCRFQNGSRDELEPAQSAAAIVPGPHSVSYTFVIQI
ncbi:hypothetical protein [Paraburkholderia dinghuensis]|uniref:Uncharacterized protein n=1 Tax=Paraburkholderia dinghuensis TaxID=2305225 RepID=A0A3N6N4R9_9BURK|nr:hypothetical protein [Paraburkholderia dinghuensis]RQH02787.1 hypothetical protein D1Y85_21915 [Paraburkholderia dinghuensis]